MAQINTINIKLLPLSDMRMGMKDTNHEVIVIEKGLVQEYNIDFPTIYNFTVADDSGRMEFTAYGEDGVSIKPGDILLLRDCYLKVFDDRYYLNVNRFSGKIIRKGSFLKTFSDQPDHSVIPPLAPEPIIEPVVHRTRGNHNDRQNFTHTGFNNRGKRGRGHRGFHKHK